MEPASLLVLGFGAIATAMQLEIDAENLAVELSGVRRNTSALPDRVRPIKADYQDAASLQSALLSERPDYVLLTLTPSAFNEQAYSESYVGGLKNTLAALTQAPKRIFFFSSTSVYSQCMGEWVDEESPTEASSFSGRTMLECEALLASTTKHSGIQATSLRAGGIYGGGSRRLLDKVRDGQCSGGSHFGNRIHVQDCARAVLHLLKRDQQGKHLADRYLLVDDQPSPMIEVEQWLAAAQGVPFKVADAVATAGSTRAAAVKASVTAPVKTSARRQVTNKRCSNKRLRDTGFECRYPDFQSGYGSMLRQPPLS